MKFWKIIISKLLLGVCLVWAGISAAGTIETQYWVCSQVGMLEKEYAFVVSEVFADSENREEEFERVVQENINLQPDYSAVCREYSTKEKAYQALKKMLEVVQERNFKILWVKF